MRDYNVTKLYYQRYGIDQNLVEQNYQKNLFIPPLSKTKFAFRIRFNAYLDCKYGGSFLNIQTPLPNNMFALVNKNISLQINNHNLIDEGFVTQQRTGYIFFKNPNGSEIAVLYVIFVDIGKHTINFIALSAYGQNFNIPNDYYFDNIFIFQEGTFSTGVNEENKPFAGLSEEKIPLSKSGIIFSRNSTDSAYIYPAYVHSSYNFILPRWIQGLFLSIAAPEYYIFADFCHQLSVQDDYIINKDDGIYQNYLMKEDNYFIIGIFDWYTSIPITTRHNRFTLYNKDFISDGNVFFNVADFDNGIFEVDIDLPQGFDYIGGYLAVTGDNTLRFQKDVNSSVDIIQTESFLPGQPILNYFPKYLDLENTKIVAAGVFKKINSEDLVVIFSDPVKKPKKERYLDILPSPQSITTRDNTVRHVNYFTSSNNINQSMDIQTFIARIENPLPGEIIEEIWIDQVVSYIDLTYPQTFFSHYFDLREAQIKNWPVLSIQSNNFYPYFNVPIISQANFSNFLQNLNNQVFFLQNSNGKTEIAFRIYVPSFIQKKYFNNLYFSNTPTVPSIYHFIKVTAKTNFGFLTSIKNIAHNTSRIISTGSWTEDEINVIYESEIFNFQQNDLRLVRTAAIPYSGNDPDFSQYVDKNVNSVEQYINLGGGQFKLRVTFPKNLLKQKYLLIVRFAVYNEITNSIKQNDLSYYIFTPTKRRFDFVEDKKCKFEMPYLEGESVFLLSFRKPRILCNNDLTNIYEYPNNFYGVSINAERDVCFENLPSIKIVKEIPDNYLDITFDFWGSYDFRQLPGNIWVNLRLPGELSKISHEIEKETYISKNISKVDIFRKTIDKYKLKLVLTDQIVYELINEYLKAARYIYVMPRKGLLKFNQFTLVIDAIDVEDMEGIMIFTVTCSEIDAFDIYTYG